MSRPAFVEVDLVSSIHSPPPALGDAKEHDADADGHRLLGLRLAGGAAHTAATGVNDTGKGAATHADAERGARGPAGRLPPALGDAKEHDADADGHRLLGLRLAGGAAHTAATGVNDTGKGAATHADAERGARGPAGRLPPALGDAKEHDADAVD